ncbi:MAG: hypothetical protein J5517_04870 [Eubacterium sp.]|nr:hypothetical protein [Eubacterium sp.]
MKEVNLENNELDREELDVNIDLGGNFQFGDEENVLKNEEIIREEDLHFNANNIEQNAPNIIRDEDIELGGNLNIGEIEAENKAEAERNLYQGILAENEMGLDSWEDLEDEAEKVKENDIRMKANLAADANSKKEQEEKNRQSETTRNKSLEDEARDRMKKAEEAKEKYDKEKKEKVPEHDFKYAWQQGTAEYYSEKRGYKDQAFDDGFIGKQAKEVHVMKYASRQILDDFKFKGSKEQKKLVKDLNEFDKFMKEIDGRTKLSPREMEVYDALSLKVYNSGKEYREHLQKKHDKAKEAYDEKHKDDKNVPEFSDYAEDQAKMDGTNKLLETIERMRKEMFEKEIAEKQKELTEKCQKEAEKAEALRDQMDMAETPEARKNLQTKMEESIVRSIFYTERMEQLQKKGEIDLKPGEAYNKAMDRLNKSTELTQEDSLRIQNTELFKTLSKQGMEKLDNNETLTNKDITESRNEYIKAQGNKRAMEKWRQSTMKKPEAVKQNEAQKNKELQQNQPKPTVPGM